MPANNIAFTAAINPAGASPVLTREQVWVGLQKKIRAAQEFVGGAIVSTDILSESTDQETGNPVVEREVTFAEGNRKVKEICTEFAPAKVNFQQPDGSHITNVISTGGERELYLTYIFEWRMPGKSQEEVDAASLKQKGVAKMAVEQSIKAIRGIDDIFALLLALSASTEELEVVLLSLTFGNVEVGSCLRNVVALFNILEKEIEWRKEVGRPEGFDGIRQFKPLVAIGAEEPLDEQLIMADFFHGQDGLAGIHTTHPHLSPEQTWDHLFEQPPVDDLPTRTAKAELEPLGLPTSFTPSYQRSHKEIIRILRENEPDTISIIAVGPLTNLALAAAEDPEAFLRVKEVISMGGAVDVDGNVTPAAEFNVFADSIAAARVYALTSGIPSSTMPPTVSRKKTLPAYPSNLSRKLKFSLFALDVTEHHNLSRGYFNKITKPLLEAGSPLAEWMSAFMKPMFEKMESLSHGHEGDSTSLCLHDPICVWYVLTQHIPGAWKTTPDSPEDIRVETSGQWTRGLTLRDKRSRKRRDSDGEVPHDNGNWLGNRSGNRIDRVIESPGTEQFPIFLLDRILLGKTD